MGNTLNSIINSLREEGLVAGSRLFVRELYMRKRFWLLEHQLGTNDASGNPPENIRVADASALERIVAAWPKEFWGGHNERYVSRKIAKRFDNEYPCLISERNERVEGAVWCVPFESHCDSQCLKSNDNAFEICNLFVIPSCRGKGIGRQLLEQALLMMARRGKKTAYSRILPERQPSLQLHLDCGFNLLGTLYCTTVLGRQHNCLVPLTKARRADVYGMEMPPCVLLVRSAWGGALEAVRSLGSRGVPVYVFVFGRDPTPYSRSRYCHHASRLAGQDAESVSRELIDWCKAQKFSQRPLLVPMIDILATFVAEKRQSLEEYFTIGAACPETVLSLVDKERANPLAADHGLDVPRSTIVRTHADLKKACAVIKFPAIAKPTWWREKGRADFKTVTFETPESLVTGLNPVLDGATSVLVQEYIQGGDDDIETFMFYRDHRGVTWGCTGCKLRQSPLNAGIMAFGYTVDIPDLRQVCTMFLDKIGYQGLGGVEFKRCGGRLVYIETNARPEAIHGLARKAGFDLVWFAYCDYRLGGLCEEPHGQREAFYLDWHAFWATYGLKNVIPWVVDLLRMLSKQPLKIAVFEWRDPGPSLYLIRKHLWEWFGRTLRKLGESVQVRRMMQRRQKPHIHE